MTPFADRTDELRELARFARRRRDLYKARSYGARPTSATRMRELERQCAQAEERLAAYAARPAPARPASSEPAHSA